MVNCARSYNIIEVISHHVHRFTGCGILGAISGNPAYHKDFAVLRAEKQKIDLNIDLPYLLIFAFLPTQVVCLLSIVLW